MSTALIEWDEVSAIAQELADLTDLSVARVQDLLREPGAREPRRDLPAPINHRSRLPATPHPGPAAFANAYRLLTMRSEGPTASTSPLSRGLCRAHRWAHSRNQIPGDSARLSVRVLEHVTILLSPGSQDE